MNFPMFHFTVHRYRYAIRHFLMPSCFYFVFFVAPRTGGAPFTPRFRPNASKMKCDHHTRAGEDRFDERIGIFYPSGAYTLFLIS